MIKILKSFIHNFIKYGIFILFSFPLFACQQSGTVWNVTRRMPYDFAEFRTQFEHKNAPVLIEGNPFVSTQQQLHDSVIGAFQKSYYGSFATFQYQPVSPDIMSGFFLRFRFVQNDVGDADRLCEKDSQALPEISKQSQENNVLLMGAWCRGSKVLTSAWGKVDTASLEDPKFGNLLRLMLTQILPKNKSH